MPGEGAGVGVVKRLEGQAKAFGFGPTGNGGQNRSHRDAQCRALVNHG